MSSSNRSIERCFEDAEDSGVLAASSRGLKEFPVCVDNFDLVDVIKVDLSNNKLVELPPDVAHFSMMEQMNCSRNYLKGLPDLSHLNALSHVDISQNQIASLPVHLCSLPLKILKASHNRLTSVPSEIGLLSKMQHLDLCSNEIAMLPTTMGELCSLRSLNVRRNQLVELPDELSKLKNLIQFDFSCNRISTIPPAFRLITSLIQLELSSNPLSSPPAQICARGRVHIFKYLSLAAQQQEKRWSMAKENRSKRSPSASSLSSNSIIDSDKLNHAEDRHEVCGMEDSRKMNHIEERNEISGDVDPRRSRTITEETSEELAYPDDLVLPAAPNKPSSLRPSPSSIDEQHQEFTAADYDIIAGSDLAQTEAKTKPHLPRKPDSLSLKQEQQILKQKNIQPDRGKLTPQSVNIKACLPPKPSSPSVKSPSSRDPSPASTNSLERSSASLERKTNRPFAPNTGERVGDRPVPGQDERKMDELEARKQQLLKSKQEILKSKQRLEQIKSKSNPRELPKKTEGIPSSVSPSSTDSMNSVSGASSEDAIFEHVAKRGPLQKGRPSNKLLKPNASEFTMRRFFDSAKEEFEKLEQLREQIESRLGIKLPDDLPASLSDGIVLCTLVNHLRNDTIPLIHVPSAGVPKLTMPKCQMNVDAFLDACRRLGVVKVDVCTAPDILEEKNPSMLCRTVRCLLIAVGENITSMAKPPSPLL